MGSFESKVSTELFTLSGDLDVIKKMLIRVSKDVQLNLTYCDVLAGILEEHGLSTAEEIRDLTYELNDEREKQAKVIFDKVTKKLDKVVDEHNSLKELLESSPVKGEA